MDLDEAITVTKLETSVGSSYLMIGWQNNSFEMYLYTKDNVWKGRFSPNRLAGFSRNLQMTESVYFANVKKCLSQYRDDYLYELKSGFFYWKHMINNSIIIEGFLPVEIDKSPKTVQPDIIEVLLALNKHLISKVTGMKFELQSIKTEYDKCLKDTEEFLNLKIEMEKALCEKFLNLLHLKRSKIISLKSNTIRPSDVGKLNYGKGESK